MDDKMLSSHGHQLVSWILVFLIFLVIMIVPKPEPIEFISFQYEELDNYYLECLSLHDGPDRVIIMDNGSFILRCADGHSPTDPHKILEPVPFVKSSPAGRLEKTRIVRWPKKN